MSVRTYWRDYKQFLTNSDIDPEEAQHLMPPWSKRPVAAVVESARDAAGYLVDAVDLLVFRHRQYGLCRFAATLMSDEVTPLSYLVNEWYVKLMVKPPTTGMEDTYERWD